MSMSVFYKHREWHELLQGQKSPSSRFCNHKFTSELNDPFCSVCSTPHQDSLEFLDKSS